MLTNKAFFWYDKRSPGMFLHDTVQLQNDLPFFSDGSIHHMSDEKTESNWSINVKDAEKRQLRGFIPRSSVMEFFSVVENMVYCLVH